MKTTLIFSSLAALALMTCGCASTIPFTVKHDKLKDPPSHQVGSVALAEFTDSRSVTNNTQIGGKWQKAHPAYIAKQGRPVAAIVQEGIREALEKVGYQIDSSPSPATPVLEGNLTKFWLTDNWGGAVCDITLQTKLRQGPSGVVLWEYQFHSQEDDWVIIPNAMTAAMNTLLQKAMEQFSAPGFANAVAGKQPQHATK